MKYKRIEHVAIAVKNLDAVRDTLAGDPWHAHYEAPAWLSALIAPRVKA